MEILLTQIDAAVKARHFFLALTGALILPDICSGMESSDGLTSRDRFIAWFDQWVGPKYSGGLDGDDCYGLRASLLHHRQFVPNGKPYERVIFIEPGPMVILHNQVLNGALNLDVDIFCSDMIHSVKAWLPAASKTATYANNRNAFLTRHTGLPPFIVSWMVYA